MIDDPPTFFTYNDQKLIDNTPNYNIAWMISVEHMQVLGNQNQTSSNNTILYVFGGVAAVVVIGGIGAAVVLRKRKLKESRKDEV
jgi:hypothetical protein